MMFLWQSLAVKFWTFSYYFSLCCSYNSDLASHIGWSSLQHWCCTRQPV